MNSEITDNNTLTHEALLNLEGQYCLWIFGQAVPAGWASVFSGSREECLAFIEREWVDMRPVSVRA